MNLEKMALINEEAIRQNQYPGRGIVIGMTPDGENYVQVYWIMGRSQNSRNRVFELEGRYVKTKAFDPAKLEDPSLIIYYPVKDINDKHIVTNGDQTDTIYDYLKEGKSFEDALNTREFEPDDPNYTPRISGFIDCTPGKAAYGMSILKTIDNNKDLSVRSYFYYGSFIKGYGHCIHTYKEDGNPIPSFVGEPFVVKLENDIEKNADYFWNLLNEENKISLLVKYINVKDNSVKFKIINKNK
ncbi:MAG: inosine monophosphate cyclohydrolase [Clostridiales bacterium]|uniref:IMP cyclohydrolase n=1 Tax=Clostridium sp. N3C TaxID=1776758 RepID=UPI00092DF91A|nr:IMP cyclohydrolase [Clostridium sp. N3C]NLZ47781.1 inosine monophosphate cyclohydrolase [Clostridiales bacterium]SCN24924.1 IMP cyclohydrolase [Clostridium sp. N3C]